MADHTIGRVDQVEYKELGGETTGTTEINTTIESTAHNRIAGVEFQVANGITVKVERELKTGVKTTLFEEAATASKTTFSELSGEAFPEGATYTLSTSSSSVSATRKWGLLVEAKGYN